MIPDEPRVEVNRKLAALFSEASKLKQQLLAITQTASDENWDLTTYGRAREDLQTQLLGISQEIHSLLKKLKSIESGETGIETIA